MQSKQPTGLETFSATLSIKRQDLGYKVTKWLKDNPDKHILGYKSHQSSDAEYHCVTILIWWVQK